MTGLSAVNSVSKSRSERPCGCSCRGWSAHQVDDVDDADLQVGQVLAEEVDGGQRLQRRHVAGAGHDDVGLAAVVVARPVPDADAARACRSASSIVEPVRRRLLAGDDDVDVVAAAQAVVGDREQACWRRAAGRRG